MDNEDPYSVSMGLRAEAASWSNYGPNRTDRRRRQHHTDLRSIQGRLGGSHRETALLAPNDGAGRLLKADGTTPAAYWPEVYSLGRPQP